MKCKSCKQEMLPTNYPDNDKYRKQTGFCCIACELVWLKHHAGNPSYRISSCLFFRQEKWIDRSNKNKRGIMKYD